MIVNSQLSRIHILLNKIGRMGYKADYVINATDGREHSTKLLTFVEANNVISVLEEEEKEYYKKNRNSEDVQRKKIISCCREMGWVKSGKADMARIYSWVLKFGYLHKKLNDYTAAELPKLVTQAENMKKDHLNRI